MTLSGRDIVVIGASAGGLAPLRTILAGLPADFPAAVFVVRHRGVDVRGITLEMLFPQCRLPLHEPVHGEAIVPGRVYVAPFDMHLLLKAGEIVVARGPKENGFRPAVDPLFRSAARAYGNRVIGVVLSGYLDDGTHGLMLVKRHGGVALVQHPQEAEVPSMPQSALRFVKVDETLFAADFPAVLNRLAREELPLRTIPDGTKLDVAEGCTDLLRDESFGLDPSPFRCPDCGGALWQTTDEGHVRFRCHVGHGYTVASLEDRYGGDMEKALWSAVSLLEETAALNARIVAASGQQSIRERHQRLVNEKRRQADTLRALLLDLQGGGLGQPPPPSIRQEYERS